MSAVELCSLPLEIGGKQLKSRLFIGTGKFKSKIEMQNAIEASNASIATVAMRRIDPEDCYENILDYIPKDVILMVNTSGARDSYEAVQIARLFRDSGLGVWVKIEVINDSKYLLPDNEETVKATEILSSEGFIVLPYMYPDLYTARKLEKAGAAAIMPLGSLIGSCNGLITKDFIQIIKSETDLPVIVDAGIGKPSHAVEALELGIDGILANTAISNADSPVLMAEAFGKAVITGRLAYIAGIAKTNCFAEQSSPVRGLLRELQ